MRKAGQGCPPFCNAIAYWQSLRVENIPPQSARISRAATGSCRACCFACAHGPSDERCCLRMFVRACCGLWLPIWPFSNLSPWCSRKRGLLRGMGTALLAPSSTGRMRMAHYRNDSSLADLAARHFRQPSPGRVCAHACRAVLPLAQAEHGSAFVHMRCAAPHAPDRCQRTTPRPAAASRSQQTGPQPGRAPQGTAGIRIGTHGDMLQHVKGRRQGKSPGKGRV